MKQAYVRKWGRNWQPVRFTGMCKTVKGGLSDKEQKFFQFRETLSGIPLWTYWIHEDAVKFCDPVVETVYKCECDK